jgi:hypothetical protein
LHARLAPPRKAQAVTNPTDLTTVSSIYNQKPNYLVNSSAVKPSVSFMGQTREEGAKYKNYVDLQDAPSGV